ncbi:MAG TPA: metallophosphoesterase family protein [Paraburkholderia sp.]|uniref:metallophosphoesterase family protein n=1 Tax=Paraburkholderia sp. TaxID=1926495 RepID=UPI002B46C0B5|nr:metallophosphoesterase family protein [Paraburkholderia sp.]HKR47901.1 metallophosphoesterase family protein [Paraburkholderia sp.]
MKFLHLSDLHITADDAANEPLRQRFAFCGQHYRDHFFIVTGDIIDNEGAVAPGTPLPHDHENPLSVMALVKTAFAHPPPPLGPIQPHLDRVIVSLRKTTELFALLPPGRVFLVPGNHDYGLCGNLYAEEYIRAFDDHLFNRINRNTDGSFFVTSTVLNPDFTVRPRSARYPISYVITQSGQPLVSLLGLNTIAEPGPDATVLATGSIGGNQMTCIERFSAGEGFIPGLHQTLGICTICFFHHHPWIHSDVTMKLRDADQLMGQLRNKVDLVLFGHRHVERRYEPAQVAAGGIRFGAIAAGSSRAEHHAWEIDIASSIDWRFRTVPIV